MQCPWDHLEPAKLSFCEEALCSIIHRPAETWSSLAYVAIAAYLFLRMKKKSQFNLWPLPAIATIIGITSILLHATSSFFAECLDVSSMFMLVNYCIVIGLKHRFKLKGPILFFIFVTMTASCVLSLFLISKSIGALIFFLQIILGLIFSWEFSTKLDKKMDHMPLVKCIGLLLVAWGIWWLDILKIVCDPSNHIFTGHSAWHIISALAIIPLYQFLYQYPDLNE